MSYTIKHDGKEIVVPDISHWNYRVMADAKYGTMSIREVYYEDGEPVSWSMNPISPGGDDVSELKYDIQLMIEAFKKPVLNEAELLEKSDERKKTLHSDRSAD